MVGYKSQISPIQLVRLVSTHVVYERLSVMQELAWAVRILCSKFLECPIQVFEECGVQSTPPPENGNLIRTLDLVWSKVTPLPFKNEKLVRTWDFGFELVQSTPTPTRNENWVRTWDFGLELVQSPPKGTTFVPIQL